MPMVPTSSAPVATNQTSFSVSSRSTDSVTRRRMRAASLAEKSSSPMGSSPAQPPFQPSPPSSSSSSSEPNLSHEPMSAPALRASNSSSTPSQPLTSAAPRLLLLAKPQPAEKPALLARLLGRDRARRRAGAGSVSGPVEQLDSSAAPRERSAAASAAPRRAATAASSGPTAAKSMVSNSSRPWPRCGWRSGAPDGSAHWKSSGSSLAASRDARWRVREQRALGNHVGVDGRLGDAAHRRLELRGRRSARRPARARGCAARRASRRRPRRCRWRRRRTASRARAAR